MKITECSLTVATEADKAALRKHNAEVRTNGNIVVDCPLLSWSWGIETDNG